MIVVDSDCYAAQVCHGAILCMRECFDQALAKLEKAISLDQKRWGAYFWQGIACAYLSMDERAIVAIEKALELGLPPILLAPFRWLEQDRPDFYAKFVVPLLARYE
jgi:tetratricopeptide (TPR) repeat protein